MNKVYGVLMLWDDDKKQRLYISSLSLFLLPQETQNEKSKSKPNSSPAATTATADDDDDTEPLPPSERPKPRGRRMAFSAEPYTEEDAASYVKKVSGKKVCYDFSVLNVWNQEFR